MNILTVLLKKTGLKTLKDEPEFKFILFTSMTLALLVSVITWLIIVVFQNQAVKLQQQSLHRQMDSYFHLIQQDIKSYNLSGLQRSTEALLTRQDVHRVEVVDNSGSELVKLGAADIPADARELIYALGDAQPGRMLITVTDTHAQSTLLSGILLVTGVFLMVSLAGILVTWRYIKFWVNRPLADLRIACEATLESGEPQLVDFTRSDRFGVLSRAFNKMQSSLIDLGSQKERLLASVSREQLAINAFLHETEACILIYDANGENLVSRGKAIFKIFPQYIDKDIPPLAQIEHDLARSGALISEVAADLNPDFKQYKVKLKAEIDDGDAFYTVSISRIGEGRRTVYIHNSTAIHRYQSTLAEFQKFESLCSLTSGIAHDFNNILSTVLGVIEFVQENSNNTLEDEDRQLLETCIDRIMQGRNLTSELLAFSRQSDLKEEIITVAPHIESQIQFFKRALSVEIDLVVNCPLDAVLLLDKDMYERSLLNLMVNARDAVSQEGRIAVTVDRVGDEQPAIEITVFNSCDAVSDTVLQRAFDPFYTTKHNQGGTGLGLSVVKGFVDQSEGEARMANVPGGVALTISFPELAARDEIGDQIQQATALTEKEDDIKILILDDEETFRRSVSKLLDHSNIRNKHCGSVPEAIDALQSERFDLLLSDVSMPGMDGVSALAEYQRNGIQVPVLFLTGKDYRTVRESINVYSDVDVLAKPVSAKQLGKKIRQMVV